MLLRLIPFPLPSHRPLSLPLKSLLLLKHPLLLLQPLKLRLLSLRLPLRLKSHPQLPL
ncbi:MAG: hypothetical protein ABSG80_14590 [Verrucomicrobiota bacterium]|jgi:hypothetical protein